MTFFKQGEFINLEVDLYFTSNGELRYPVLDNLISMTGNYTDPGLDNLISVVFLVLDLYVLPAMGFASSNSGYFLLNQA